MVTRYAPTSDKDVTWRLTWLQMAVDVAANADVDIEMNADMDNDVTIAAH